MLTHIRQAFVGDVVNRHRRGGLDLRAVFNVRVSGVWEFWATSSVRFDKASVSEPENCRGRRSKIKLRMLGYDFVQDLSS